MSVFFYFLQPSTDLIFTYSNNIVYNSNLWLLHLVYADTMLSTLNMFFIPYKNPLNRLFLFVFVLL